jgi:hypothetical protein
VGEEKNRQTSWIVSVAEEQKRRGKAVPTKHDEKKGPTFSTIEPVIVVTTAFPTRNLSSFIHLAKMRRKQERLVLPASDDADVAAGGLSVPTPPMSRGGMSIATSASDIEFFEDMISEPVLVLGVDISHLSRNSQFSLCASGVFFFSLLYGYLQELLSVQLCSRQLGLFLATVQFSGYALLSFLLRTYVYGSPGRKILTPKLSNLSAQNVAKTVPFKVYLALSLVRALDLGMTNLAMQYINYPAKTLMKSSRVVFTMIFGVFILKKSYKCMDYFVVLCMFVGLVIFMHADSKSSAVFQPLGVIMLVREFSVLNL